MLDEMVGDEPSEINVKVGRKRVPLQKGQSTITVDMLFDNMKNNDTFDRIIDVFTKMDQDGSGFIDATEFTEGVMCEIENCNPGDVSDLFHEIDVDRSGQISYYELKDALHAAASRAAKAKEANAMPQLPHHLARRKKDVLTLYRQFEKQQGGGHTHEQAKSVSLPTFADCLKLYYPKIPKEDIAILAKWVDAYLQAKERESEDRIRQKDESLITSLDVDGDGRINITEFLELAKSTGLSKVSMRARFRDKDFGNAGFLTMQQMRDILRDLREEGKLGNKKPAVAQAPPTGSAS